MLSISPTDMNRDDLQERICTLAELLAECEDVLDGMGEFADPLTPSDVRFIRKRLGFTQGELALHLGIKRPATISDWERGEMPCTGPARLVVIRLYEEAQYDG